MAGVLLSPPIFRMTPGVEKEPARARGCLSGLTYSTAKGKRASTSYLTARRWRASPSERPLQASLCCRPATPRNAIQGSLRSLVLTTTRCPRLMPRTGKRSCDWTIFPAGPVFSRVRIDTERRSSSSRTTQLTGTTALRCMKRNRAITVASISLKLNYLIPLRST